MTDLLTPTQIARLRRVTSGGYENDDLYALPLVDDFAAHPNNPHPVAIYRTRIDPVIIGRDPDGSHLLDSARRIPTALAGYALHLPWEKNPIPANKPSGRSHWTHQYRAVSLVRNTAMTLALHRIPPQERIRVRLDWEVATKHKRDEDNLVPTMKALVDGLVRGGVIVDDTRQYCLRDMPVINYRPNRTAHMRLWIWIADRT